MAEEILSKALTTQMSTRIPAGKARGALVEDLGDYLAAARGNYFGHRHRPGYLLLVIQFEFPDTRQHRRDLAICICHGDYFSR